GREGSAQMEPVTPARPMAGRQASPQASPGAASGAWHPSALPSNPVDGQDRASYMPKLLRLCSTG
ncbi:MAG TPA: hypothetical protein VGN26_20615, partial [Armatimonadota bacterium]